MGIRIVNIVGARPQFIKVAPVIEAIKHHNDSAGSEKTAIDHMLLHTGQHYDYEMSKIFFDQLTIPKPDYHLEVGSGSHGAQTGLMLQRVEEVLLKEKPQLVIVYGDTNSTLAGALAASKLHISVAHVEAGLRSYNRRMPEETNRVLTDHLSIFLFCPTATAVINLAEEGITEGVHLVGDVMLDSVQHCLKIAEEKSNILECLDLTPGGYALATVHRAENTDSSDKLGSIFQALAEISQTHLPVIVPLHPRTKECLERFGIQMDHIRVIPPVSYLDMILLEKEAKVILTDSGGVQKEAFWFQVPCVTLRDETEWVETLEGGWNMLVGADKEKILNSINSYPDGSSPSTDISGTEKTAQKIMDIICKADETELSEK